MQRKRNNQKYLNNIRLVFSHILLLIFLFFLTGSAYASNQQSLLQRKIKHIENTYGGKIGLYAINTANNKIISFNANKRFPFCSTSKVMTVAAILLKSSKKPSFLQKIIYFKKAAILKSGYAPITKNNIKNGMSVEALCAACIRYSDNTAANILMRMLGGPQAVTKFARRIGDDKFNLNRYEPQLNSAIPGDKRDTSTPKAMAKSLQKLILGHILPPKQHSLLEHWLITNTTGNNRIRAGAPKNWLVGDKTGTGQYGTTNDIAILWPPNYAPIVLSIYYTQKFKDSKPNGQGYSKNNKNCFVKIL